VENSIFWNGRRGDLSFLTKIFSTIPMLGLVTNLTFFNAQMMQSCFILRIVFRRLLARSPGNRPSMAAGRPARPRRPDLRQPRSRRKKGRELTVGPIADMLHALLFHTSTGIFFIFFFSNRGPERKKVLCKNYSTGKNSSLLAHSTLPGFVLCSWNQSIKR
jgi:hypothetical protein